MKHLKNNDSIIALIWALVFGLFSAALIITLIRFGFASHWFCLLLAVPSAALSLSFVDDIKTIENND